MTTAAKSAFKTLLQYGDGATPEKFTTLSEVISLDPGEASDATINVSSMDSAAAEFINTGLVDYGEVGIEANFVNDATDTAARAKLGGAKSNWQICFPNYGARNAVFTINAELDTLISEAHGLTTGQPVRCSTTDTLPTPLVAGTTYYVIYVDADTIKLATSNALAVAGTAIDIADGAGVHTLHIGNRLSFAAIVKGHGLGSQMGEQIKVKLTAKITGVSALS